MITMLRDTGSVPTDDIYRMTHDMNHTRLTEICQTIEKTHHVYVRHSLATIEPLLSRVSDRLGEDYPFLKRVLRKFRSVADSLSMHIQKEEYIIFPNIKKLEQSRSERTNLPQLGLRAIKKQLDQVQPERKAVASAMADIRRYTSDFTLPKDADEELHEVYRRLNTFDHDLKLHEQLENNILFPSALKLEAELNDNH